MYQQSDSKKINRGNFKSNIHFLNKCDVLNFNQNILEIGSGTGNLVNYLKQIGYNITGTELNDDYIKFASRNFNIRLVKMSGDNMQFPDESIDTVISFDTFEHIPNTDQHLNEVHRILKKNGYYLFGTPNKITNIPFEIWHKKSFTKWKTYHCSLHNYWPLKNKLKNHGFNATFIKVPVVNQFFKEKINKYFGNFGLTLISILNPDKLPVYFGTNFYIKALKI